MSIDHVTDADGKAILVDATPGDVEPGQIMDALQAQHPMIASMVTWTNQTRAPHRQGSLLDRDRFVAPDSVMGKIATARRAAGDDAVGGVLDSTEALALKRVSFTCRDIDEQNVWNQWAALVDLDSKLRSAWRVLATDSQFVMAMWWGTHTFRVRGTTELGNLRRKTYANLRVPVALSLLDHLKVTPVGNLMFGQERLAYIATREEAASFDQTLRTPGTMPGIAAPFAPPGTRVGDGDDPVVSKLLERRYVPSPAEAKRLREDGVDTTHLFLMRPDAVFRHTMTKADYEPWAQVRMESVFELLDIKHQLRQMDRAHLIGASNFIVLVKVGSKEQPGLQEEVDIMTARVKTIAQVPLIVGDHRLNIEIITPKLDVTLNRERYDTLDLRIVARLYRMFLPTGAGADNIAQVSKLVGTNLQNTRHMLLRSLERHIFTPILDANPELGWPAKMRFHPGRIALEFDAAWASFLLDLREAREISRDTIHSQFELDQDDEAFMLEREAELYDDTFRTFVPHGANPPDPDSDPDSDPDNDTGRAAQRRAGRRAGRRRGGAAPGSGQGQAPRNPRSPSDGRGRTTQAGAEPSRTSLYARAQELGIPGRSSMGRAELADAIQRVLDLEAEHDDNDDDERDEGATP